MTDSQSNQLSNAHLGQLTEAMEAAGIFVAVDVRDGALILSGEVDSEEMHQAALDLAGAVAGRGGLNVEDAIEVLEIDVDLRSGERADIDSADLSPMDADTVTDVGTVDPGLAGDEAIPYFPPTDPVIGEQLIKQDEVQVIGGFQPTSDFGDEEGAEREHFEGDERISDDVRRELSEDASTTDLTGIEVETIQGVVHLRGEVETMDDAENAEAVASRVPGVVEVREDLTVRELQPDRNW